MRIKVLYCHHDNPFLFWANRDRIPSLKDIKERYSVVYEEESESPVTRDQVFHTFNVDQSPIETLPSKVKHTSMSVGDIVILDNSINICLDLGWFEFELWPS